MMTPTGRSLLAAAFVTLVFQGHASAQSADKDGCYSAPRQCVRGQVQWLENGRLLSARMTNNCGSRVYIKFCIHRANGSRDCGADGLPPGRTKVWNTSNADRRMIARFRYVGSLQSGKDWVCAGRSPNWNAPL